VRSARLFALVGLLPLAAVAAAIALQDRALPFGLWNERAAAFDALSHALLGLTFVAALPLLGELRSGSASAWAARVRGLLFAALLLELCVTAVDRLAVSRADGRGLGGPYHEQVGLAGTRVFLKRPHEGSPFGFRSRSPAPPEASPRLLFLGDSYTEGSGRDAACNYPEVAERTLRVKLAPGWSVMNAGVAGYGPHDAADLLGFLLEQGYRFDGVVLSVFLENDFTDNLPGTERRVVAGINFRFPESRFLRTFHPLNTRTFRFALFLVQASRLRGAQDDAVRRGDGRCRPPPPLADPLPDALRTLVARRLERNSGAGLAGAPAEALVAHVGRALDRIQAIAREHAMPFVLVLFPDRIRVDAELRSHFEPPPVDEAFQLDRFRDGLLALAAERGIPVIDAATGLAGTSEDYRPSDTHLSDVGNERAGRTVGAALAHELANQAARVTPRSPVHEAVRARPR